MATDELDHLLNYAIRGEASDENKAKCLCLAIKQGKLSAIRTLLDHGADPCFILPGELVPIIYRAAKSSSVNVECFQFLLDLLLNRVMKGEDRDDIKVIALCLAIKQDNLTAIRILLNRGADPYFSLHGEMVQVMHHAAQSSSDNAECLQLLIEHRMMADGPLATHNVQNVLNQSLQLASFVRNPRCVTYLLEKGADVKYQKRNVTGSLRGGTPLVQACVKESDERKCLQTVDILLNHGADRLATDVDKCTALHWAVRWGKASVVNRLLSAGSSVNMQNGQQLTPLLWSFEKTLRPNIDLIKCLLQFGASIQYTDDKNNPRSALVLAVSQDHNEAVELFLKEGADPDFMHIAYSMSESALTEAIMVENVTAIKLLIQYNCDVDCFTINFMTNGKTMSAFRLAARHFRSPVTCKMLAIAGCDNLEMNKCITKFDSLMLQLPDAHLWQDVKEITSSLFTLQQLGRLSIRHHFRHLGRRMRDVSQLPLPKILQDDLMFTELDLYI